jgi:thiol-disulfide isomerase/thioredoxin
MKVKWGVFLLLFFLFFSIFVFAADEMENPDIFLERTAKITNSDVDNLAINNFYLYNYTEQRVVSLNSYQGSVVLLEFWASWSRHCLQEIQVLNDLHAKYSKKGLTILAINIEDKEVAREFLKNNPQIKFNVLFGAENMAREYNLSGLPCIYLLDRRLEVSKKLSGFVDRRTLDKEIKKML